MVKPLDLYRMIYSISDEIKRERERENYSHALNFTRISQWMRQDNDDTAAGEAIFIFKQNERDGRK